MSLTSGDGSLVWPTAIAFDSTGNGYVTDEWTNRVSIFSKDGEYISKWRATRSGDGGSTALPVLRSMRPITSQVDTGNNRIQKFTKDGRFQKWGSAGSGPGQFNMPWGIVDREGDVYVSDWRNDRIQKFASRRAVLMQFGTSGTGEGQFNRPSGVAVDQEGVICCGRLAEQSAAGVRSRWDLHHLEDRRCNSLQVGEGQASPTPIRKCTQSASALTGWREKGLWGPTGVAVDDENRIFVAESARNRVQVYRKLSHLRWSPPLSPSAAFPTPCLPPRPGGGARGGVIDK